jgi:hypothetical protein
MLLSEERKERNQPGEEKKEAQRQKYITDELINIFTLRTQTTAANQNTGKERIY